MTRFPGVVTLNEDHVPVTVGLDDDRMSLVAGEVSIGEWQSGEYVVIDLGEGTFVIEAEQDSISFLPDDPDGFARGIGQDQEPEVASEPALSQVSDTIVIKEGPPPRPSTVAAFYALAIVTAALGIWALISLI